MPETTSSFDAQRLKRTISSAARENILPAIVLQIVAVILVLSYFFAESTQPAFTYISDLKQHYGSPFAIVSTAIFGGLIPYIFLLFKGKITGSWLVHGLFVVLVWAFMGWLIDSFYQLQALMFGQGNDLLTVVKKTAVDQLIFTVFITSPLIVALYMWRDNNFDLAATKVDIKQSYLFERLPTTIVGTWCVWLPAVSLIYTMPLALQLPLFNLVLCFFVLLLTTLGKD